MPTRLRGSIPHGEKTRTLRPRTMPEVHPLLVFLWLGMKALVLQQLPWMSIVDGVMCRLPRVRIPAGTQHLQEMPLLGLIPRLQPPAPVPATRPPTRAMFVTTCPRRILPSKALAMGGETPLLEVGKALPQFVQSPQPRGAMWQNRGLPYLGNPEFPTLLKRPMVGPRQARHPRLQQRPTAGACLVNPQVGTLADGVQVTMNPKKGK
jgi:hypothetical protein